MTGLNPDDRAFFEGLDKKLDRVLQLLGASRTSTPQPNASDMAVLATGGPEALKALCRQRLKDSSNRRAA